MHWPSSITFEAVSRSQLHSCSKSLVSWIRLSTLLAVSPTSVISHAAFRCASKVAWKPTKRVKKWNTYHYISLTRLDSLCSRLRGSILRWHTSTNLLRCKLFTEHFHLLLYLFFFTFFSYEKNNNCQFELINANKTMSLRTVVRLRQLLIS